MNRAVAFVALLARGHRSPEMNEWESFLSFPYLRAWTCNVLLSLVCVVVVAQAPPSFHPAAVLDSLAPVLADGSEDDVFGAAVALLGGRMVRGVPYHQVGTQRLRDAVYAFQREGTQWRRTTLLHVGRVALFDSVHLLGDGFED